MKQPMPHPAEYLLVAAPLLAVLVAGLMGVSVRLMTLDVASITRVHPLSGSLEPGHTAAGRERGYLVLQRGDGGLQRRRARAAPRQMLIGAAVSGYMTLDDLFQVHEFIAPRHLGVPDEAGARPARHRLADLLAHGVAIADRTGLFWLLAALGWMGVSVLFDAVTLAVRLGEWQYFFEDGSEWVGLCCWLEVHGRVLPLALERSDERKPMSDELDDLLSNNRRWAEATRAREPGFFTRLAQQQTPQYMWIGCADSRVPANEITGLDPGEVFVHRNVANVVVHSDLNALSTIQFAVEHLKVKHIIVVGHYGCAGVRAAMRGIRVGLADNWLRHVQDVRLRHRKRLDHLPPEQQEDILCEMNVIEQVGNVALSTVLQDAWAREQEVAVHGWVYGLRDGLLKNLECTMDRPDTVVQVFGNALKRYPRVVDPDDAMDTAFD